MTAHRLFVIFVAAYFIVLGIGAIALGVDAFVTSPILGEDVRLAGIMLVFLGVVFLGGAANGIKINFFPKAPDHADIPTA